MNSPLVRCALLLGAIALAAPARGQDAAAAAHSPLSARLAGAWKAVDGERILNFDGDRCVDSNGISQSVFRVAYGADSITRKPAWSGPDLDEQVEIEGDVLRLTYTGGRTLSFERLPDVPPEAITDPLPFGKREPSQEERVRLQSELRERVELDQGVRNDYQLLMQAAREAGALDTPEGYEIFRQSDEMTEIGGRMRTIDLENTLWLADLIGDVGWIDAARFGERACMDAFLIVQHSGYLRLMTAALPEIEREATEIGSLGQQYALLYDRTQLSLGGNQRYGSQLSGHDGSGLVVLRLEDPAGVDERRATLGMGPLEDYLDRFRADGERVTIQPAD